MGKIQEESIFYTLSIRTITFADRHKLMCDLCHQPFSFKTELFIHKLCVHWTIEEFRGSDGTTDNSLLVVDIVPASNETFVYKLKVEIEQVPKESRWQVETIDSPLILHVKVEESDANESVINGLYSDCQPIDAMVYIVDIITKPTTTWKSMWNGT